MDINLQTVALKDLEFCSEYKIKITRTDYIHGFVSWFDVFFSHGTVPIKLTTSPYKYSTHWKQTILYLDEGIPVNQDDIISGSVAVKKSKLNPRDLDIKISVHMKNHIKDYNLT